MTTRPMPEWAYPVGFFAIAILIAIALWAVGDGRGPGTFASEVQGARILLADERHERDPEQIASIQSALDSLDPDAVAQAER